MNENNSLVVVPNRVEQEIDNHISSLAKYVKSAVIVIENSWEDEENEETRLINELMQNVHRIDSRIEAGMSIYNTFDYNKFVVWYIVANDNIRNHFEEIYSEIITIWTTEKIKSLLEHPFKNWHYDVVSIQEHMNKIYAVNPEFDFSIFNSEIVDNIYFSHFNKWNFVRKDSRIETL